MDRPDHILIVDDDAEIRTLLGRYFEKNGLRATAVADGRAMWQALNRGTFDLLVLDLMLPGDDGLTLCRNLRAHSDIPVIVLTSRGEETDRIVGLEMGADDYLPKPFSAGELLARIKVILRRARSLPPNLRPDEETEIRFAGWVLDTTQRNLVSPDGVVTPIGGAECQFQCGDVTSHVASFAAKRLVKTIHLEMPSSLTVHPKRHPAWTPRC